LGILDVNSHTHNMAY